MRVLLHEPHGRECGAEGWSRSKSLGRWRSAKGAVARLRKTGQVSASCGVWINVRHDARLTTGSELTALPLPFPSGTASSPVVARDKAGLLMLAVRALTFMASWLTIWRARASSGWLLASLAPLLRPLRRLRCRRGRDVAFEPVADPDGLGSAATAVVRFGLGVPAAAPARPPSEGEGAPLRCEVRRGGEGTASGAVGRGAGGRIDGVSQKT